MSQPIHKLTQPRMVKAISRALTLRAAVLYQYTQTTVPMVWIEVPAKGTKENAILEHLLYKGSCTTYVALLLLAEQGLAGARKMDDDGYILIAIKPPGKPIVDLAIPVHMPTHVDFLRAMLDAKHLCIAPVAPKDSVFEAEPNEVGKPPLLYMRNPADIIIVPGHFEVDFPSSEVVEGLINEWEIGRAVKGQVFSQN
jgi:hypothetical protein